jgi:hypothetical protein
MNSADLVQRMRRAFDGKARLETPVPVEVESEHVTAEDYWATQRSAYHVLYDVWLRVERQPGAQPGNEIWMLKARARDGRHGGESLTWRGAVDRIELMCALGKYIPGIAKDEIITRVVRLWSVIYPNHPESGPFVTSGGTPGPAE